MYKIYKRRVYIVRELIRVLTKQATHVSFFTCCGHTVSALGEAQVFHYGVFQNILDW